MQKIVFYHISRDGTMIVFKKKHSFFHKRRQKVGPKSCATTETSTVMSRQVVPCFGRTPHKSSNAVMFYCGQTNTAVLLLVRYSGLSVQMYSYKSKLIFLFTMLQSSTTQTHSYKGKFILLFNMLQS